MKTPEELQELRKRIISVQNEVNGLSMEELQEIAGGEDGPVSYALPAPGMAVVMPGPIDPPSEPGIVMASANAENE